MAKTQNQVQPYDAEPLIADGAGASLIEQGAALQRTQTPYATAIAVQKPRNLIEVEKVCCFEAVRMGERGFYGWGAGKDRVEGPSVKLALIAARNFLNCVLDLEPIQETKDSWIFTAAFIDLETGYTLKRQFRQSKKWTIHGRFDRERADDMRFQIGQSKALRNVVLNALPDWLLARMLDACRGGVRESIEQAIDKHGLEAVTERAIKRADAIGCPEDRLLACFGRLKRAALTIDDLCLVWAGCRAIEDGVDTLDAVFPAQDTQTEPADTRRRVDAVRDALGLNGDESASAAPARADFAAAIPRGGDEQAAAAYEQRIAAAKADAAARGAPANPQPVDPQPARASEPPARRRNPFA